MEKNKVLKEVHFYLLGRDVLSRIQLLSFHFLNPLIGEVDIFLRRVVRRCVDLILVDKICGENLKGTSDIWICRCSR